DGGPARNRFAVAMRAWRERASPGVEVWKSSQMWSGQRSVVRSIAWLGLLSLMSVLARHVRCDQYIERRVLIRHKANMARCLSDNAPRVWLDLASASPEEHQCDETRRPSHSIGVDQRS